jgi:hypothetical protein
MGIRKNSLYSRNGKSLVCFVMFGRFGALFMGNKRFCFITSYSVSSFLLLYIFYLKIISHESPDNNLESSRIQVFILFAIARYYCIVLFFWYLPLCLYSKPSCQISRSSECLLSHTRICASSLHFCSTRNKFFVILNFELREILVKWKMTKCDRTPFLIAYVTRHLPQEQGVCRVECQELCDSGIGADFEGIYMSFPRVIGYLQEDHEVRVDHLTCVFPDYKAGPPRLLTFI